MYQLLQPFLISFIAGFLPVLIWLWFLEHEDKHPEPKKLTFYAFLSGMLSVVLVIPLQLIVNNLDDRTLVIVIWAFIEEAVKFLTVYIFVLRRIDNDEPIDSVMYLIACALGFAALENALYMLGPLRNGDLGQALITLNFRFMGATLLHVVSSSVIGVTLALSYYKDKGSKRVAVLFGLVGATLLHTFFNFSIIIDDGSKAIISFFIVWIALIVLLLFFEKIKKLRN